MAMQDILNVSPVTVAAGPILKAPEQKEKSCYWILTITISTILTLLLSSII